MDDVPQLHAHIAQPSNRPLTSMISFMYIQLSSFLFLSPIPYYYFSTTKPKLAGRMIGSLVRGGPLSPSLLPFSLFLLLIIFPNYYCLWVVSLLSFSMRA